MSHEIVGGHVGQPALADGHILQARVLHQTVQLGRLKISKLRHSCACRWPYSLGACASSSCPAEDPENFIGAATMRLEIATFFRGVCFIIFSLQKKELNLLSLSRNRSRLPIPAVINLSVSGPSSSKEFPNGHKK